MSVIVVPQGRDDLSIGQLDEVDVIEIVGSGCNRALSLEGTTAVRGTCNSEDMRRAANGSEACKDAAVLQIHETRIAATPCRVQVDCVAGPDTR
jgi:hypothetical protein